jgi:WD40 repeat protein
MKEALCASASDDGQIIVFNYNTHRVEGILKFENPEYPTSSSEVKICKFLEGTELLVSADLDGYIHFWCVTTGAHVMKNKHLCSTRDHSKSDVGEDQKPPFFPIRAMDYDAEE